MAENVKIVNDGELKENASAQDVIQSIIANNKAIEDLSDEDRKILIDDFNERNKGVAFLTEERATEEYKVQCRDDFAAYQTEYVKLSYEIAKKDKALEYAKFLDDWNTNYVMLPQSYWKGCLKFREVIMDIIKKLEENPNEKLTFDFAALTYTYNLMMGPVGRGVEFAEWMANNQEPYNAILERLAEHMDLISLIKKKIGMLQIKWSLACQGFVLKWDESLKDLQELSLLKTINLESLG